MSNHVVTDAVRPDWPSGRPTLAPAGAVKGWCANCHQQVYAMQGDSGDRGAWSTRAGEIDCTRQEEQTNAAVDGYEVLDD